MSADLEGDDMQGFSRSALDALVLAGGMHKFVVSGKSDSVRSVLFGARDLQVCSVQTATAVMLALHFIR